VKRTSRKGHPWRRGVPAATKWGFGRGVKEGTRERWLEKKEALESDHEGGKAVYSHA